MDAFTIKQILSRLGKKHKSSGAGQYIISQCIFDWNHKNGDKHPSFVVKINNAGGSYCFCYACHRDAINFKKALVEVQSVSGVFVDDIVDLSFDKRNQNPFDFIEHVDMSKKKKIKKSPKVFKAGQLEKFHDLYHPYLTKRGISEDTYKLWNIRFDRKYDRVVLPFINEKQELVGAIGRDVGEGGSRYYNYWKFEKSNHLFGENFFKKNPEKIVLHEGPFDAIRMSQHFSYSNEYIFLACCGSSLSNKQIQKIKSKMLPVILMFDGDKAGKTLTEEAIAELNKFVALYRADMPDGMDAGDIKFGKKDAQNVLENAEFIF